MICSRDQTYGDVLYGASDAALELDGSKIHTLFVTTKESDQPDPYHYVLIRLQVTIYMAPFPASGDYDLPSSLTKNVGLSNPLLLTIIAFAFTYH